MYRAEGLRVWASGPSTTLWVYLVSLRLGFLSDRREDDEKTVFGSLQ